MKQKRPDDLTINISSPNDKFVDHNKHTYSNVAKFWFRPKEGVTITRVCDDNGFVCECEGPVDFAKLFDKYEKPYLLYVQVKKGEQKCFIKADGKWNEIAFGEYNDYESYLIMLGRPDRHIAIDVNKPEDTKFWRIYQINSGNRKPVMFYPNTGYYARAVVDGDKTIWKAENDSQTCLKAEKQYIQNQKELVRVWITDISDTKLRYYLRVKGRCTEIDEDEYFKSLCSYHSGFSELGKSFNVLTNPAVTCH